MLYPTVHWAGKTPDHPALIGAGRVLDYRELERRVLQVAARLAALGVAVGDRVIVSAANSIEWILLAHALPRVGAVLVPVATRFGPKDAHSLIDRFSPSLVICDESSGSAWNGSRARRLVDIREFELLQREAEHDKPQMENSIDPAGVHSIVCTSGVEGEPKGVCLSFRNHMASALASAVNLGIDADDRWLLNLPLHHIGGLSVALRAAIYGTTVVVHEGFDADDTFRAINEQKVTQMSLVPTTLRRLLDALGDRHPPTHLRSVLVGGGPMSPDLHARASGHGMPVLCTYGMTETASQTATQPPAELGGALGSGVPPLPLVELAIRDEGGRDLPVGEEGRVHVRGPMVGMGYWTDRCSIMPFVDRNGWFATSDSGELDRDGSLRIYGRIDNVIISGGEKIHAEEIESALLQIEGVKQVVVIPEDNPEWGQSPVAYVEMGPGTECDVPSIAMRLAGMIAPQKRPKRIIPVAHVPLLPSGKADRRRIREVIQITPG